MFIICPLVTSRAGFRYHSHIVSSKIGAIVWIRIAALRETVEEEVRYVVGVAKLTPIRTINILSHTWEAGEVIVGSERGFQGTACHVELCEGGNSIENEEVGLSLVQCDLGDTDREILEPGVIRVSVSQICHIASTWSRSCYSSVISSTSNNNPSCINFKNMFDSSWSRKTSNSYGVSHWRQSSLSQEALIKHQYYKRWQKRARMIVRSVPHTILIILTYANLLHFN